MPYVTKVAKGELPKLLVYWNDDPAADGTGVRDYLHVVDLAKGHVAANEQRGEGLEAYNLGPGILPSFTQTPQKQNAYWGRRQSGGSV